MKQPTDLSTAMLYRPALLWLMDQLGSAETSYALQQFEERLGHLIPPHHRQLNSSGNVKWEWYVHWSRQDLVAAGLMGDERRGVWTIMEAGRAWLRDHPDGDPKALLLLAKKHSPDKRAGGSKSTPRLTSTAQRERGSSPAQGITLEMLEQTRQTMPAEQFGRVWGALYEQLLSAERARMTTPVTQAELGERAYRIVRKVHGFLTGKSTEVPTQEVICSWIHTCYVLELHREAAALLKYLEELEGPSLSSYARRLAEASRVRLGW